MSMSMKDVAQHAGVSLGTVSNVLNGRPSVNEEMRERVLFSVRALQFVRNESARQLKSGESRSIALLVSDSSNPFFGEIARGAEEVAAASGLFQLIASSHGEPGRERAYLEQLEALRVQGVLLAPIGGAEDSIAHLRARGVAAVLLDARRPNASISTVRTDHVVGGYAAASHLVSTGSSSIGFVGGPAHLSQVTDRLEGVKIALREVEVSGQHSLRVWHAESSTTEAGERLAAQFLSLPVKERPDGIVASNDLLATGFLHQLVRAGVGVPDDVTIVGYDDIPSAKTALVPLTTVRQRSDEIGSEGARLLLAQIADPGIPTEERVLEPELIVRESSMRRP